MSGLRAFSRYETVAVIGEGAMGTVYEARDPRLGRRVAIKTIKPEIVARDPAFTARFQREARTVAALSHPNIVAVFDCEDDYIVMEFVEGRELKQEMQRRVLGGAEIAALLTQFAAALDYAHERGVIHRDVKPANALVTAAGTLKVTDFGIAKLENSGASGITHTGQVLGTPAYMSPEQVAGKPLDRRSDQFSLAVVAYEMLAGRVPFPGDTLATIVYKIIAERHRPVREFNAALPERIDAVMDRALAKEPAARFPTCGEFAAALREALAAEAAAGIAAAPRPTPTPVLAESAPTVTATRPLAAPDAAPAPSFAKSPSPPPATAGRGAKTAAFALVGAALLALPAVWLLKRASGRRQKNPLVMAESRPARAVSTAREHETLREAVKPVEPPAAPAPEAKPAPEPAPAPTPSREAALKSQPTPTRVKNPAPVPAPPATPTTPAPESAAAATAASAPLETGWRLLRQFKLAPRPGELTTAAWGPDGELLVGDRDEGRLRFYGPGGRLLYMIPADEPGRFKKFFLGKRARDASAAVAPALPELKRPVAAARAGEKLWIADPERRAVVLIDSQAGGAKLIEGFRAPDLVAASPAGAAVWDRDAETVTVLNAEGKILRAVTGAPKPRALLYAGGALLAGNSDGLFAERGGKFLPALRGEGGIEKIGALAAAAGRLVAGDSERKALVFFAPGGLKPEGRLALEPLKIEPPRAILARGEELWLIDEDARISVLSRSP